MSASITVDNAAGSQITVNNLLQLSVDDASTVVVSLGAGVSVKVLDGGRVVFMRDDVLLLPRLETVLEAMIHRAAPRGARAVHRLREALNGVLARYPDAVASNSTAGPQQVPRWAGPSETAMPVVPDEPLPGTYPASPLGAVFWMEDGARMRAEINMAGIIGQPSRYRVQPAGS